MSSTQPPTPPAPSSEKQTWLITGASSGLGLALSFAALEAGFRVVGGTRDPAKAEKQNPEFAQRGGVWVRLDPGHPDSYEHFATIAKDWDVDVLVNNAGYAFIGGAEDTSEEEIRAQLEVNFFGPMRGVRAILPLLRAKRQGHIVLISSAAGFIARPGRGTYSASKYAVEAAHESLSHEIKSLNQKLLANNNNNNNNSESKSGAGIGVLIVQPGAFATGFADTIITPAAHASTGGCSEAYKGTALDIMLQMSSSSSSSPNNKEQNKILLRGDPQKAAKAILDAVVNGHEYLRLLLGPDCVAAFEAKMADLRNDYELTRDVALGTDLDAFKG